MVRPPMPTTHQLQTGLVALLGLLGLALLVGSCSSDGQSGHLTTPPAATSLQLEQQAITNLVELYRTAMSEEDIDRLATLLGFPIVIAKFWGLRSHASGFPKNWRNCNRSRMANIYAAVCYCEMQVGE